MGYTRNIIIDKCKKALEDPKTFYQADVINYRGRTSDTNELYNEIVAEFVCNNLTEYCASIPQITRKNTYKTDGHDGSYSNTSNREEEIIAMQLFNQSNEVGAFDFIGEILDYQTPLKSVKTDVAGKIDLLSFDGEVIRVLELKKPDSTETMLRCALEGYTYMKIADWTKLIADFKLPHDAKVKASPFVFNPSSQKNDMEENRPNLHRLMELVDSKPYYIIKENEKFRVEE